ncbi:MAG: GNAT family N-acetyltransferase [Pseudomonadota bacterium]|nr:GNAT family N-acetyltransferase [Pseudomonadota bacterium]
MKLKINDSYTISDIALSDKAAYIEHFQEKQIYLQTLAIPFPYTEADADWWINNNIEATKNQDGRSVNWAIRQSHDDYLIGGIGFHGHKIGKSHKAELGYWLAKPYWNKGIMTEAVKKTTEYGFKELGLTRVTAHVFDFNIGSAKVLEKSGYQFEGLLRNHYKKDGKIFSGKLYAVILEDFKKSVTDTTRPDFIKHYLEIQNEENPPRFNNGDHDGVPDKGSGK